MDESVRSPGGAAGAPPRTSPYPTSYPSRTDGSPPLRRRRDIFGKQ
jgi:hypothetical protein